MGEFGFAAIAAAMLAAQSNAQAESCAIDYATDDEIAALIRDRGFSFDTFDQLCPALLQHGLQLVIVGGDGVMEERAYGWATLSARRIATRAQSDINFNSITLYQATDEPAAADALYESINGSANGIADDMAEVVQSIEQEEARLRAAFSTQGRGGERPQEP
jgi:hypothetical protein